MVGREGGGKDEEREFEKGGTFEEQGQKGKSERKKRVI